MFRPSTPLSSDESHFRFLHKDTLFLWFSLPFYTTEIIKSRQFTITGLSTLNGDPV